MTQLSLNMQSYRKSDALFCGAEIFIRYNCMCTDKFAPSFHFHPCSSLQVGSKQIGPIVYFHTRPSKWPKKKVIGIWLCFIVLFCMVRQENLGIKKRAGLAKVFGTILCVSGALLLSFYHGKTIGLGQSSIHWRYAEKMEGTSSSGKGNMFLGPLVVILSTLVWAAWFIIQVIKHQYILTSLIFLFKRIIIISLRFSERHKQDISSSLHEHWLNVFHGKLSMRDHCRVCRPQGLSLVTPQCYETFLCPLCGMCINSLLTSYYY